MIKIDNNYKIDSEGAGCSLIFAEERISTKGKNKGESYIFEDSWHFLNVQQCLEKYMQLSLEPCLDVKECMVKFEELRQLIKNLKLC